MRRDEALSALPVVYRQVLRLLGEGRSLADIAERVGVEPHAVPSLVELAEAKLARLTGADPNS